MPVDNYHLVRPNRVPFPIDMTQYVPKDMWWLCLVSALHGPSGEVN